MRVFKLPKNVNDTIDKINRNFLWVKTNNPSKLHHISWNKITRPKHMGGLGIKRYCLLNGTYMAKLKWDLNTNPQKPWVSLFIHKYKDITCYKKRKMLSYTYKSIFKDSNIYENCISSIITSGKTTNFWNDS